MKVSAFGVAGLAAAVLLTIALWPESQRLPATPQAIAQQPAKGKGKTKAAPQPASLEEKLAARTTVEFLDTPLGEVFDFIGSKNQIQVYVNRRALGDESIMLDAPVTMTLADVKVETVLDLALEQVSDQLAYLERDGVLIISTVTALEGATEVRVYNCRDLLAFTTPPSGMAGMMMPGMMGAGGGMEMGTMPGMMRGMPGAPTIGPGAGGGVLSPEPGPAPSGEPRLEPGIEQQSPGAPGANPADPGGGAPPSAESPESRTPPPESRTSTERWNERAILAQISGMMGPGMGPMGGGGFPPNPGRSRPEPQTDHERKAARLMDLIITAVEPNSWQDTGGFGTISEYEGLIVVNHNARTHKKIENVLSMLRQSAGLPEHGVMPGMSGMMMGGMGSGMMGGMGSGMGGAMTPAFGGPAGGGGFESAPSRGGVPAGSQPPRRSR